MSRSDWKRLNDIRRMCAAAVDIVGRGRRVVEEDAVLWLALERAVEIAGEAATQLDATTRAQYPDVDWRGLLGTRVILAHAYHRVNLDLLWAIAAEDLPALALELGPMVDRAPD